MLPAAERVGVWREIASGAKRVVIGPRSAVFAPLSDLGLVVVDEEHETAYKQEETPRYHGRDVAIYRAHLAGATVLLGSATPSLESTRNAQTGRYERITLARGRELPPVERVDLRTSPPGPARFLSPQLLERIAETTAAGAQTILLLNRRGYAVFLLCESCGYVPRCPHCSVTFTYHLRGHALRCHYCGRSERAPVRCPLCGAERFRYKGTGTQRVEEELLSAAPRLRVARMDLDTTRRRGAHGEILRAFGRGDIDCLVGTQMIAKGLDFPRVRLVGVVSADTALHLPDFRAAEKTFSLLVQVAGRAGRGEGKGLVLVQSWTPEHPAIALACRYDIDGFVTAELAEREALRFPPFSSLIAVTLAGPDADQVDADAVAAAERLNAHPRFREAFIELLGPSPAAIAKVRDRYRWQILLKSRREHWRLAREILRETLSKDVAAAPGVQHAWRRHKVDVTIDVDAQSLL
jgi:primosomal protein N' (replication factor Y)